MPGQTRTPDQATDTGPPSRRFAAAAAFLLVATVVTFARHDRLAAWLLVPYLVWILYATGLNISLQVLN